MGIHNSKPGTLRRKKKSAGRQRSDVKNHGNVRKKYISGLAILARPWEIVGEEPAERWRKSNVANRFGGFPTCNKKLVKEIPTLGNWYSDVCHDLTRDKSTSMIAYQAHGSSQRYSFPYDANNLLQKTLNEATYRKVIPSAGGFLALYFTYQSLEDRMYGIVPLFNLHKPELLYFFVEKTPPYDPKAIAISSDGTMLCLLIARNVEGRGEVLEIQVYSKRPMAFERTFHGPTFDMEYEVPGLQPNKLCPKIMFDPRYYSSRLGIINVNAVQNIRVTHYFMVYDLKRKRPVTMPHENYISDTDDFDLLDADYSPDGAWVHALVGHVIPELTNKHMRALWIINSNSLEIVRAIEIGQENIESCFMNFLPIYSKCTRQMALRHRRSVKVYKLPPPDTLKAWCRASLLANYKGSVDRLDTTQDVIDYIKLKPYL